MDLSRNAESAKRARHPQSRRTIFSNEIWEQSEDDVLRATATLTLSEVQKLLPHRTACAIDKRRGRLHLLRRKLKPWTTREDRILSANIDKMDCRTIASLLPGRSKHAVQSHAWFLGVRKGYLRPPKATGFLVYDEVRNRAYEDRVSLCALDRELGTGTYFQQNDKKRPDWKKLARAVAFFGGQMTVDWKDV